jgi:methionyl aminopeptidase
MSKKKIVEKYTESEIEILKEGGRRLAQILHTLGENCVAGTKAKDLDTLAEKLVREGGDIPVFKNYQPEGSSSPFPASLCVSINDCVAHGIPGEELLKESDVVSLDLGLRHDGLVVDSAITVIVGEGNKAEKKLIEVTKKALEIGIEQCVPGNRVNDVGIAIEKYVTSEGMKVVDILCGHAVGREIHSEPIIPHADYGPGGEIIKEGMVLAIEPHISLGTGQISLSAKDKWSYMADDGCKSAQFEHTILVTDKTPLILTAFDRRA